MKIGTALFGCFAIACFSALVMAGHIDAAGAAIFGFAAGLIIGFVASVA